MKTPAEIWQEAWLENPYLENNSRGSYNKSYKVKKGKDKGKIKTYFIPHGYPLPRRNETDDDMKGSDYIGPQVIEITPDMVGQKIAVFKGIEIKTFTDILKAGQIKFHNWLLSIGGLSEIHQEQKDGTIKIIKEPIV
jgi:hypothetical protein